MLLGGTDFVCKLDVFTGYLERSVGCDALSGYRPDVVVIVCQLLLSRLLAPGSAWMVQCS